MFGERQRFKEVIVRISEGFLKGGDETYKSPGTSTMGGEV